MNVDAAWIFDFQDVAVVVRLVPDVDLKLRPFELFADKCSLTSGRKRSPSSGNSRDRSG